MKNPFKKEISYYSDLKEAITPYQKAKQTWDERIGAARQQAYNWRLIAMSSSLIAMLSILLTIMTLVIKHDKVFVAEVTKGGRIVNVVPLKTTYQPDQAQIEYFLSNFVKLVRTVPLDPVLARQNWLSAYHFLTRNSIKKLNNFLRKDNPLDLLGKKTVTVKIRDTNPISDKTYNIHWDETVLDHDGQNEQHKRLSGTFTVMIKPPTSKKVMLENPLGIYITDFNISEQEI